MIKHRRNLTDDPVARRGRALYISKIKRKVARGNKGRIVAIDVDSEDYAVGEEVIPALAELRKEHPHAKVWFERIGFDAVDRFASWRASESKG